MSLPGCVDVFTPHLIAGWAWDPAHPDAVVAVELVDGDEVLLTMRADQFRRDLSEAGIGTGRYGFTATALHHVVPRSRRDVRVRRAFDRVELSGSGGTMIATAGAHLMAAPGSAAWGIAFGGKTYALTEPPALAALASCLPVAVAAPEDDPLPPGGTARVEAATPHDRLLLEGEAGPGLRLALDPAAALGAHLRWCRGAPDRDGWVGPAAVLEVEEVVGLSLHCWLPEREGSGAKMLRIAAGAEPPRCFSLPRGGITPITFRTPAPGRHRIAFYADPEPTGGRPRGFQLRRLDLLDRMAANDSADG